MKKALTVGIICYPSIGGSGVVATQLGDELASLGHNVHFISYEEPFRLNLSLPRIHFHKVNLNEYELFRYPDYTLPLAVKMVKVHEAFHLDILHVHYAVPHATAALLAGEILRSKSKNAPHIVTTLHGTDITLVGADPNLHPIIDYSINRSCGISAVSKSLKSQTNKFFSVTKEIEVIYNFFTPKVPRKSRQAVRDSLGVKADEALVIHLSNARPVKRIPDLLKIVAATHKNQRVKLLILAGGSFASYTPLVRKLKIEDVCIVKENVSDIEEYLNAADLGLYTSEQESFGMGILETMTFGHPVIASRTGGIPEVIEDGKTGLLYEVGDIDGFVGGLTELLKDWRRREELGRNAKRRAQRLFSSSRIVSQYIEYYRAIMSSCDEHEILLPKRNEAMPLKRVHFKTCAR